MNNCTRCGSTTDVAERAIAAQLKARICLDCFNEWCVVFYSDASAMDLKTVENKMMVIALQEVGAVIKGESVGTFVATLPALTVRHFQACSALNARALKFIKGDEQS